jgi:tripartite-type tricarboxylate transporter receptor subunit TctC
MIERRSFIAGATAAGLIAAGPSTAQTAAYPNRPVRMIVPFAPGGGVDVVGRIVAQRLQEMLGVPFVVENRAGASGTVGGGAVQSAPADGYTLLFSASTHIMARQVLRSAPYDPVTDFTPIAMMGKAPLLLVMTPSRPQRTITEIVEDARRTPDRWTFGVAAMGAAGHLATVLFMKLAKLDIVVAPYRGTAPALTDVAAGNVQLMIDPVLALLPMAQSGGVRAIAITSKTRSPLAPEIPTAAEAGLPGLEFASWYGVWAPKGLPANVVARLEPALAEIMRDPAVRERTEKLGLEPEYLGPADFARHIAEEVATNTELLRSVNFQPE